MPGWSDVATGLLSNLLLCAVCLGSSMQTLQIHRGAAAGFLLQALVALLETAVLLAAALGLGSAPAARPPDAAWVSTVVGLPLLVFAFHWLSGDCSTANILLGGALLLAGGWDYFTEEGKAMAAHSITMVASITILIISVFTGNAYGVLGGLLVGTAGLLAGSQLQLLLALSKRDVRHGLMAAANLTLRWALQTQHQELGRGGRGLQPWTDGGDPADHLVEGS
ncbi:transmembrane protein 276 [Elgaria multicarinata webbii]|uniref:transmembrane protein 276 n=1 Tax=Elgaria multicarinata webbii TaxID=159646 RepID=UPI002FCD003A